MMDMDPLTAALLVALGALPVAALWLRSARGWRREVMREFAALRAEIKALRGGGSK